MGAAVSSGKVVAIGSSGRQDASAMLRAMIANLANVRTVAAFDRFIFCL
jgi:hypothetical protein